MLSPDCNSLLGSLPIIVPIGGTAVWTWEWQALGVILVATFIVWLLISAALEERPYLQKRVLAVLAIRPADEDAQGSSALIVGPRQGIELGVFVIFSAY